MLTGLLLMTYSPTFSYSLGPLAMGWPTHSRLSRPASTIKKTPHKLAHKLVWQGHFSTEAPSSQMTLDCASDRKPPAQRRMSDIRGH